MLTMTFHTTRDCVQLIQRNAVLGSWAVVNNHLLLLIQSKLDLGHGRIQLCGSQSQSPGAKSKYQYSSMGHVMIVYLNVWTETQQGCRIFLSLSCVLRARIHVCRPARLPRRAWRCFCASKQQLQQMYPCCTVSRSTQ